MCPLYTGNSEIVTRRASGSQDFCAPEGGWGHIIKRGGGVREGDDIRGPAMRYPPSPPRI